MTRSKSRIIQTPSRYGVLLNALAKQWTGALHEEVQRLVPSKDLFLTDNFRQANKTVEKLLERGYEVIFTGGGDGTIVYLINAVEEAIEGGKIDRKDAPVIGVLRMGTGNALATTVGANEIAKDLNALRSGASLLVQPTRMVTDSSTLFPFAGFGWDAAILNDYEWLKNRVRETALENYMTGLFGYATSVAVRSVPKAITEETARISVWNKSDKAFKIDQRGKVLETLEEGEPLYRGPARVAAIATTPYWGFNIRMFPNSQRKDGYASLRVFDGSPADILSRLPSLWRGYAKDDAIHDFLVRDVDIRIEGRKMAYQVAGDPEGYMNAINWRVYEHSIPLAVPI